MLEIDLSIRPRNTDDNSTAKRHCVEERVQQDDVGCAERDHLRDLVNNAFAEADAEAGLAPGPLQAVPTLPSAECSNIPSGSRFSRDGLLSEYGGVHAFMREHNRRSSLNSRKT